VATEPTAGMKGGDFSALLGSQIGMDAGGRPILRNEIFDPSTLHMLNGALVRDPFPSNIIPPQFITSVGSNVVHLYPDPNGPVTASSGLYTSSPGKRDDFNQFTTRVDQRFNDTNSLFGRYSYVQEDRFDTFDSFCANVNNVPGFGCNTLNGGQQAILDYIRLIGANKVNEARTSFTRVRGGIFQQNRGNDIATKLGITGTSRNALDYGVPIFNVTGYDRLGEATNLPQDRHDNTFEWSDSLSWTTGRHTMKYGEARRQYVYQQTVRASLTRTNGQFARREKRQYLVIPSPTGTEKKLVSFQGEYRRGKQSGTYQEPVKDRQNVGIDAELLQDLTEELINAKEARDGIPHNLFPLRSVDLPAYSFTMKGELQHQGQRTYRIAFEPAKKAKEMCVHERRDEDADCVNTPWMGEAWIDAAELEPVRIDTHLAFKVPWAVRTFLGTNLKQAGFAITYQRIADGVWFPATYGTEFQVDVLFLYKRTIAMNLESSSFQKTDSTSKIEYDLEGEWPPR
jgi:hypothetical protein